MKHLKQNLNLWNLFKQFRWRMAGTWLIVLLENAMLACIPLLIGLAIDDLLAGRSQSLWLLCGFLLGPGRVGRGGGAPESPPALFVVKQFERGRTHVLQHADGVGMLGSLHFGAQAQEVGSGEYVGPPTRAARHLPPHHARSRRPPHPRMPQPARPPRPRPHSPSGRLVYGRLYRCRPPPSF